MILTMYKWSIFYIALTSLYIHQLLDSSSACRQSHILRTHVHPLDVQILNVLQWLGKKISLYIKILSSTSLVISSLDFWADNFFERRLMVTQDYKLSKY